METLLRAPTLLLVVLSLLLAVSAPGMSQAASSAPGREVDQAFVLGLLTSPDPKAELSRLSLDEQAEVAELIEDNLLPTRELVSTGPLNPEQAAAVGLTYPQVRGKSSALVAAVSGCWSHYYYTGWSLFYTKSADSWMQLNWCGSNGRITSSSITNVGGSATVVSYDGNTRSSRNVGWEVRGVTTHKFSFYLAGVTKCMQVRGGATGLYSRSLACES